MPSKRKPSKSVPVNIPYPPERFLWHLKPTWVRKYDHDHWWVKSPLSASPEAALWEVLRRHPKARPLLLGKLQADPVLRPEIEIDLSLNGLQSWPKLLPMFQEQWRESLCEVPAQRGVNFISKDAVVIFGADPGFDKLRALAKKYWDGIHSSNVTQEGFRGLKGAKKMWACRLNERIFHLLSIGYHLVAFDPNRPGIETIIATKVKSVVASTRKDAKLLAVDGRSFHHQWLNVIERFEKEEFALNSKRIRDDQLFARYRRMIGCWIWPS